MNKKAGGMQRSILCQRGAASGCLLFLIFIAAVGYLGFKFGEPCWEYLQAREKIREALTWAAAGQAKPDKEILQMVLVKTEDTNIDIRQQNIKILHEPTLLTISVSWKRDVILPGYTVPLNFHVTLSEEKRWGRGGLIIK